MKKPSIILLVTFKSSLTFDEVSQIVIRRKEDFKALNGLQQKYYLQEPDTMEYAGLYLWDSKEDFDSYNDSGLRKTIATAYKTIGEPRVDVFNIFDVLKE